MLDQQQIMKKDSNALVSIQFCDSYQYDLYEVKTSIKASLDNLGGISRFINPGERVLLKVNLLMKKDPNLATTTHPVFVQALAELLMEYGARVMVGDSPGGLFNERALRSVYQGCGMTDMAENCDAELSFNTGYSEVQNPQGLYLKKLTNIDMLRDADKVISVAKLKTHGMMKMTCAVKNMFGTIPGTMKAEFHLNYPELDRFADSLIDVCLAANPVLSLVDGIIAMEGEGPSSGDPRRMGVILASADPYELDLVAAAIIGAETSSVPTLKQSINRGLCSPSIESVSLVGDPIERFMQEDFKKPPFYEVNWLKGRVPGFIYRGANRAFQSKPVFVYSKCVCCKDCYHNCPPKAISMSEKRPVVDLDKCIRCYCCQELCPHKAVVIKRPWLLKQLSK